MVKKKEVPTPPQLPRNYWAAAQKIYEEEMKKAYDKGWADGFEAGKSYPRIAPFD